MNPQLVQGKVVEYCFLLHLICFVIFTSHLEPIHSTRTLDIEKVLPFYAQHLLGRDMMQRLMILGKEQRLYTAVEHIVRSR